MHSCIHLFISIFKGALHHVGPKKCYHHWQPYRRKSIWKHQRLAFDSCFRIISIPKFIIVLSWYDGDKWSKNMRYYNFSILWWNFRVSLVFLTLSKLLHAMLLKVVKMIMTMIMMMMMMMKMTIMMLITLMVMNGVVCVCVCVCDTIIVCMCLHPYAQYTCMCYACGFACMHARLCLCIRCTCVYVCVCVCVSS